jgi:hypothetical protein
LCRYAEGEELLGPGGQLREYLSRMAEADSVAEFVRDNPWANHGPAAPPSTDEVGMNTL